LILVGSGVLWVALMRWCGRDGLVIALCAWALAGCTGEQIPEGFVVLVESSPQSLDPRFVTDDIGTKLSKLVFAGLVTYDTVDSTPELVLAESIEVVSATEFRVRLKPGLTFHDGSPLTADDVRVTFESTPHEMKHIDHIEVLDALTLTFTLEAPFAPFLMSLELGIVSRGEVGDVDKNRPDAKTRVATLGAGAYALQERRGDQLVVLKRFDDYVLGPAHEPRLVFKVVRDDNARLIALLGGSADLALNNVTPLMLPVVEDDNGLTVESEESIKFTYLMFNTRVRPLDDVRVRRAFALAIDRDEIIDYKFRGLATKATGMLAPSHWAYEPDVRRYATDPAAARALLDAAGYPDPDGDGPKTRFDLTFRVSASKFRKAIAELIAAQLSEVGVGIRVETMEFGMFFSQVHAGNFELASLQWPSPIEPDLLYVAFHSSMVPYENPQGDGRNRGAFSNARLDAVLEQGRREPDRNLRKPFYAEAQKLLADELPYVPLWHEQNIAVLRKGVTGFQILPNARLRSLEKVSRE